VIGSTGNATQTEKEEDRKTMTNNNRVANTDKHDDIDDDDEDNEDEGDNDDGDDFIRVDIAPHNTHSRQLDCQSDQQLRLGEEGGGSVRVSADDCVTLSYYIR
jgi:hypothetical protein